MVLYVIRTGNDPKFFPEVTASLLGPAEQDEFIALNAIILKACHPDKAQRYRSATELRGALADLESILPLPKIGI
jgi:hypothetical protein